MWGAGLDRQHRPSAQPAFTGLGELAPLAAGRARPTISVYPPVAVADHSVRNDTLTAAGAQVAPHRRRVGPKAPTGSRQDGVTDDELWEFYDTMPSPNWFVRFVSNQMALVRFYAAKVDPDSPDPVMLGEENDRGERIYSDDEQKAQSAVKQIRSRSGDVSSLIRPLVENLTVPGQLYMVAVPRDEVEHVDPDSGESVLPTEVPPDVAEAAPQPDDVLWFEIASTSEVRIKPRTVNGQNIMGVERSEAEGSKWKQMSPHAAAFAIWNRHPKHSALVESPFRAACATLRRLRKLEWLIDAAIESRLLGRGIWLVPAGVSPEIPEWMETNNGETYWDKLLDEMAATIDDRGMAAAAVPIVVEVPEAAIEKFTHVEFPLTIEAFFESLQSRFRDDLAEAWNVPTSQLTEDGIQDLNHWSQWAEQESTIRTTWRPMSEIIASAWTELILHPALRDAGVKDWHTYVVWYDLEALTARPTRVDDASAAWDRHLISDEVFLEASGFHGSDVPEPDELATRVLFELLAADPSTAPVLLDHLGHHDLAEQIRDSRPAPAPVIVPAPPGGDDPDGLPGVPDTDPTDDPVVAAGATVVDARVEEAIRWAVHFERDRIGRKIRNALTDPQHRAVLDGAVPNDFMSLLGSTFIEQIMGLTTDQLIQPGAFEDLASRASALGVDAGELVSRSRTILKETLYLSWPNLASLSLS